MNSRVFFLLLSLILIMIYPISKPLYAKINNSDNITIMNSDKTNGVIILQVSKNYEDIIIEESGKISIDLGRVMGGTEGKAFNTNARFEIGSSENPVFSLTNNSDQNITLEAKDLKHPGVITLHPVSDSILVPGETLHYYFEVNTKDTSFGEITSQLQIR